ncbi:MAG: hypothetical protein HYV09_27860 [Deltaproteobacteria bacterium]|nr:hypothetical protein [Deltaproteobacteria bacterium]
MTFRAVARRSRRRSGGSAGGRRRRERSRFTHEFYTLLIHRISGSPCGCVEKCWVFHLIAAQRTVEMSGMGAFARLISHDTAPEETPGLHERTDVRAKTLSRSDGGGAKTLGLTLLRPARRRSARRSLFTLMPEEILLLDEGIAVATYADDGAVQYASLEALLEDHGLRHEDLIVVERVRGVGRWDP